MRWRRTSARSPARNPIVHAGTTLPISAARPTASQRRGVGPDTSSDAAPGQRPGQSHADHQGDAVAARHRPVVGPDLSAAVPRNEHVAGDGLGDDPAHRHRPGAEAADEQCRQSDAPDACRECGERDGSRPVERDRHDARCQPRRLQHHLDDQQSEQDRVRLEPAPRPARNDLATYEPEAAPTAVASGAAPCHQEVMQSLEATVVPDRLEGGQMGPEGVVGRENHLSDQAP